MDVLAWQVFIVLAVVFSTLLFGRRGLFLSAMAAVVWTIWMIFTARLFILQLITIVVAFNFGVKILQGPRLQERMAAARKWTLASIAFTAVGLILFNSNWHSSPSGSASEPVVTERPIAGAAIVGDATHTSEVRQGTVYRCDDGKGRVWLTGGDRGSTQTPPGCSIFVNGTPASLATKPASSDVPSMSGAEDIVDPATKAAMYRACLDLGTPNYDCATGTMR